MNNAFAHQLMTSLWLASPLFSGTGAPLELRAELYRARRDIEGEDIVSLTTLTDSGAQVFFHAAHACGADLAPHLTIDGDDGKVDGVIYSELSAENYKTGERTVFNMRERQAISSLIDYLTGLTEDPDCPVSATRNFTVTVNCAHESSGGIHDIPARLARPVAWDAGTAFSVDGLADILEKAQKARKTFSELGVEWAVGTPSFDCRNYKIFTGGRSAGRAAVFVGGMA
jgi:hypothetical protein